MIHCHVPPEPSVRARAWKTERHDRPKRSACDASISFHSIGRCIRVEERQRQRTTYTATVHGGVTAYTRIRHSTPACCLRTKLCSDASVPPPLRQQLRRYVLEHASPDLSPTYASHIAQSESIQGSFTRRSNYRLGREGNYANRLKSFRMFSLEDSCIVADMKLLCDVMNSIVVCPKLTARMVCGRAEFERGTRAPWTLAPRKQITLNIQFYIGSCAHT
ncbi:hypothetical protein EVAR_10815_1 [Eumeta japonica]|uniref:Uncharacterized protein n=1 Tax=Eumeta variegata TaxID=151549 RepID=A0A4C1Y9Q0_EUMVA|nr:hypothetical protein EVAR_10815_1 [Eumeta japonica]